MSNHKFFITLNAQILILLLFSLCAMPVQAATITVDGTDGTVAVDGTCSISEAIINANDDAQTHSDCAGGSGADTINLSADITLTAEYENDAYYGRTGTPPISTAVVLDGMGHVLERDIGNLTCNLDNTSDPGEFRLLRVTNTGDLALNNMVIRGGCVDGNGGGAPDGGGIFNGGTLSLLNAVIDGNQASTFGGGVGSNTADISDIINSTFSNNSAGLGGGLSISFISTISSVVNSTFSNNSASSGGGLYIGSNSTISSVVNSTFSGNTASDGSAIYNYESTIDTLQNSLFHDGSSCGSSPGPWSTYNGSNNIADGTSGSGCPGILPTTLTAATVGPLADNGCTAPLADGSCVMTHALLSGSEAIDLGDANATATDQRGVAANGFRDMGAYEYDPVGLCPTALQTDGFSTSVATAAELIEAMECANANGEANGGDTINLSADITLTAEYENDPSDGRTGTPPISTAVILDGQGHVLARDGGLACTFNLTNEVEEFRLLRVISTGDLTLTNAVIRGGCVDFSDLGTGINGGGLLNRGTLSLQNSVIDANQASFGGGIASDGGGNTITSIDNTTFSNNSVRNNGGGLSATGTNIGVINNSTFSGNTADDGGGLYLVSVSISAINNSTFSGNIASNGGGLYLSINATLSAINNSTFSGNTANSGSAIYNDATINNLQNSLFHEGSTCGGFETFSGSNNMADGTSGTDCPGILPTTLTTTTIGPLADNGCTTPLADGSCVMTHALLPGSEALDVAVGGTTTDQRGFSAEGIRDIGAYELQAIESCPTALQTDGFSTSVATAADLIEAMECANANGEANGGDTINLSADITLTAEYENDAIWGSTGTPPVTTAMTLDGQGHALERDGALNCDINFINDSGEFRLLRVANTGHLALNHAVVRGGCADSNGVTDPDGGGVANEGTLSISNSVIDNNQSSGYGGGLTARGGVIEFIENTTFSNNYAQLRGGGLNQTLGAITSVTNTTFSNNNATDGGGMYVEDLTVSLMNNVTFSGNTATMGSAIVNQFATITNLQNSLFHDGSSCAYISGFGSTFAGSNNMADGTSGTDCPGVLGTSLDSNTIGPLDNNGCTTLLADGSCVMTHALLANSEALDVAVGGTATDQRGFNANAMRDIGAYEAQIPVITAPADVIIEATGPSTNTPALGTASATDADSDDMALNITNDAATSYVLGVHTVTWTVTDNHGHQGTDTQSLTVQDTTPPVLSLLGTSPVSLNVGDSYSDAGASATDLVDDDTTLTTNIVVNNLVNTSVAGSYTVSYNVTDNAGNAASQITRTVHVNALLTIGGNVSGLSSGNSITLQNNGLDDLVINANGGFTFATALTDGSTYAVSVLTQPNSPSQTCSVANGSGTLSGADVTNVTVNCDPVAVQIQLSTSTVNFGGVLVGQDETEIITVENPGAVDLTINGIAPLASPFSITGGSCDPLPITLTPGNSCTIEVTFSPTDSSNQSTQLIINSNAVSSPDTVTVSGNGFATATPVPTLNQWALLLLLSSIILSSCLFYRHKFD